MRKNRSANIYTNIYNGLTLSLIYSHDKSKTNGELTTTELYRKTLSRRIQVHPRNKDNFASMITTQYATPEDHCSGIQQHHACTIARPFEGSRLRSNMRGHPGLR